MKPNIIQPDKRDALHTVKIIIIKAIFTAMATIGIFGFTHQTKACNTKELPPAVSSAFSAKYGSAPIKKWKQRGSDYLVSFLYKNRKCVAFYTSEGIWEKTEIPIPWTRDLPLPVRDSWKRSGYATYRVDAVKEVLSNDKALYVLHVDNGPTLDSDHYDAFKRDYALSFSKEGVLIDKTKLPN